MRVGKNGSADAYSPVGNGTGEVKVGKAQAGQTISVKRGQTFAIELPVAGGSGFAWKVTKTDRSFAYPTESNTGASNPGAQRTVKLTWDTGSPFLSPDSTHEVTVALARGSQAPIETLTFKVKITA